jgi:hypothetical protein
MSAVFKIFIFETHFAIGGVGILTLISDVALNCTYEWNYKLG